MRSTLIENSKVKIEKDKDDVSLFIMKEIASNPDIVKDPQNLLDKLQTKTSK